ncbi:hypothetical protein BTJ68_12989 [Hortaea werneckii EXF-2000]|uniref:Uncharacterized protein n=1 Tax=Hortaea werneckii EXF-2000 TaxID=1157616 RepID=A0A1Z5SRY5_HORWE|nr:hypothetical protein BTJ68_12989 [Hortaea werneckii EXF-2000]
MFRFSISERFDHIRTEPGNLIWDMIPVLQQATVDKASYRIKTIVVTMADISKINGLIGIKAILQLPCLPRRTQQRRAQSRQGFGTNTRFLPTGIGGVTALLTGGLFVGSLLLHWEH